MGEPRETPAYDLGENDRVVVFRVAGGVDEGESAMTSSLTQRDSRDRCSRSSETYRLRNSSKRSGWCPNDVLSAALGARSRSHASSLARHVRPHGARGGR